MAAAIYNFFIEQGSDFEIDFVYRDSDQNPINTSEYCVRLRLLDSDGNVRLYSSNAAPCSSYELLNLNNTQYTGTIKWKLPASTTASYKFDFANYELHIISSLEQLRIATGRIEITKSIFSDCPDETIFACKDCDTIVCADSAGQPLSPSPTPTVTNPTQTPTATTNPCEAVQENLCDYLCRDLDLFAKLYSGSGLTIYDDSLVSGTINIPDTGIITNVEVSFAKLKHSYPQDLKLILAPPSGDKILLSYHNKINNYSPISGLSFSFSDKALPGTYLNNRSVFDLYVNVLDKTDKCKFTLSSPTGEPLLSNFDHLIGSNPSGDWTLYIEDDDVVGSGTIDGWNMIITYQPPDYEE